MESLNANLIMGIPLMSLTPSKERLVKISEPLYRAHTQSPRSGLVSLGNSRANRLTKALEAHSGPQTLGGSPTRRTAESLRIDRTPRSSPRFSAGRSNCYDRVKRRRWQWHAESHRMTADFSPGAERARTEALDTPYTTLPLLSSRQLVSRIEFYRHGHSVLVQLSDNVSSSTDL